MFSINVSPATVTTQPISTIGTDHAYVELRMRRLGERIELVATAVEYNAFTGRYLTDELGVEIVDPEEAIDAACDLQGLAHVHLDAKGCGRGYARPVAFGEAVEKALDAATHQEDVSVWPVAAE